MWSKKQLNKAWDATFSVCSSVVNTPSGGVVKNRHTWRFVESRLDNFADIEIGCVVCGTHALTLRHFVLRYEKYVGVVVLPPLLLALAEYHDSIPSYLGCTHTWRRADRLPNNAGWVVLRCGRCFTSGEIPEATLDYFESSRKIRVPEVTALTDQYPYCLTSEVAHFTDLSAAQILS